MLGRIEFKDILFFEMDPYHLACIWCDKFSLPRHFKLMFHNVGAKEKERSGWILGWKKKKEEEKYPFDTTVEFI